MTRVLIAGGSVFDGTGAPPMIADIVIESGRIVEVGTGLDGDERVDASSLTVLPGLFDCHTHVTFSGADFLDVSRRITRPFSMRYFEAVRNLEVTLRTGITSIRDAGGADLGTKTAVETGLIPGPRMQISIAMLSQTGGHGDRTAPSGGCLGYLGAFPGNPAGLVDGPDEMRRRVRELIREGADVIKVATSGGVLSLRDDPRHGHFRDDELSVLTAEATAANLFVMAHAQATDGIKAALRAGVRSIEHGVYLNDEAIQMMLDRGAWLVPTLSAPRAVLAAAESGINVPETALRKTREAFAAHTDSFRRAVEAGVKIAMGTDSGVGPHGQNLGEVALMAEHSAMTAAQAWVATTKSAAELLGVDNVLGTLEPGKHADIVLLEGALNDLNKLGERVTCVLKDGVGLNWKT